MRKEVKDEVNKIVEFAWKNAKKELENTSNISSKKLRSCSACVIETENYYFLKSYNTVIAFIDKNRDTLYDVLRLVYGYTATSAQHIAKFNHDYSSHPWGCEFQLRYYA